MKDKKKEDEMRIYLTEGWSALNQVFANFTGREDVQKVYIENFCAIESLLRKISRDTLIALANQDSVNWRIIQEKDGTLVAVKK